MFCEIQGSNVLNLKVSDVLLCGTNVQMGHRNYTPRPPSVMKSILVETYKQSGGTCTEDEDSKFSESQIHF